jgi:methyltransferase family protein
MEGDIPKMSKSLLASRNGRIISTNQKPKNMKQSITSPVGLGLQDEIKVYYTDDPDPEKAGQGLAMAPFIYKILGQDSSNYWMMAPAEQAAFVFLLEHLRPCVAIEIGTRFGGTLQVLAKYCSKVYSLDIDPDVEKRLTGKYSNVEFIIGPSTKTLPLLIQKLQSENANLEFVLVDGDHSASGVEADINNVLAFKPTSTPLYITMHDSFNPQCRKGLLNAKWAENPCVRAVEIDFVAGSVNPSPSFREQLWGGIALAVLLPGKRESRFEVMQRSALTFNRAQFFSFLSFAHKLRKRIASYF